MKKFISVSVISLLLLSSSTLVFADNNVSNMATEKGGQHVDKCAQTMERGISKCLKTVNCQS